MIKTGELSRIGFGGYRISQNSAENIEAIKLAIEYGCNLIDTSSNYGDGDSEKLIGNILNATNKDIFIITKAGYISGKNLVNFQSLLKSNKLLPFTEVSSDFYHSIAPEYLKSQIDISLNRLNRKYIDAFLLHSPEYFFKSKSACIFREKCPPHFGPKWPLDGLPGVVENAPGTCTNINNSFQPPLDYRPKVALTSLR